MVAVQGRRSFEPQCNEINTRANKKDCCRQRIEYDTNLASVTRAHSPSFASLLFLHSPPKRGKQISMENISSSRDRLITTTQSIGYHSVHFIGTDCISSAILIIFSRHTEWVEWNRIQLRSFKFPNKHTHSPILVDVRVFYSLTNSPAEYLIRCDNNESHCANCESRCVPLHVICLKRKNIINNHYWSDAAKWKQLSAINDSRGLGWWGLRNR